MHYLKDIVQYNVHKLQSELFYRFNFVIDIIFSQICFYLMEHSLVFCYRCKGFFSQYSNQSICSVLC